MQQQPSLLQRLAPTIGGVLGGIGGELVDPLGGGIAGAAAGSALGKSYENVSSGQNATSGLGGAAIEGGLGQAGGEVLGAGLGFGGDLLSKFGSDQVAKETTAKATADSAKSLADEFGFGGQAEGNTLKKSLNFGNSLDLADKAGIPKTAEGFANAPNIATGVDPNTGETGFLNNIADGIVHNAYTNPAEEATESATPATAATAPTAQTPANPDAVSGDVLQPNALQPQLQSVNPSGVDEAQEAEVVNPQETTTSQNPTGVDLSGYQDELAKAIGDRGELGTLNPQTMSKGALPRVQGAADQLRSQMEQTLQEKGFQGLGSTSGKAPVDNALDLSRELQRLSDNYAGSSDAGNQARKYVIDKLNSYVKDQISSNPAVDEGVKAFKVPEDLANGVRQQSRINTGSEDFGNYLIDQVNNAQHLSDLTDQQRQLIDMRELGKKADSYNKNVIGTTQQAKQAAQAAEGLAPDIPLTKGQVLGKVLKSGSKMSGSLSGKAGDLLQRMSLFTGDNSTALGRLKNVAGGGALLPALGAGLASSASAVQGQGNGMQLAGNVQPQMGQMQPGMPQQGMPATMNAYETLLGMLGTDPSLASSLASPIASLAPLAQKSMAAQQLLPQVEQQAQGIAGQGAVGGGIQSLLGQLGFGPAAAYQKNAATLQALLAQLGIGGAVPGVTSSPQAVPMQFNAINSALNSTPALAGVPAQ